MGMFDYIRSEIPLPDGFAGELQTKDFNCDMGLHVIRADGRLILEILDHTDEARHEDANYHGIVRFYGSDEHKNWHEYLAKFTDGNLVGITIVGDDA